MRDYAETRRRPVALSDVAYRNGADIAMMRHAQQAGILELIAAYGGWNTAENTNGMCLAHACIHSYYAARGFAGGGRAPVAGILRAQGVRGLPVPGDHHHGGLR